MITSQLHSTPIRADNDEHAGLGGSPQPVDVMDKLKGRIRSLVKTVPVLGRPYVQREELRAVIKKLWEPPGHFYSPIPSIDEVRQRESAIFDVSSPTVRGIDLNEAGQLQLFSALTPFYRDQPFPITKEAGLRYFFENGAFSYFDAIILYAMLRHVKPRRVIEIGCGYSSCVLLDTNERFFNNGIECTFIEPYPQLLQSLLKESDRSRITVIPTNLQDVDVDLFARLEPNDILFVDSSHVTKTGSDVNYVFFDILPRLIPGVFIHFHDIFHPFEYPKPWVYQGRAWNEAYLLRAFLQYNDAFEIQLSNSFIEHFHRDLVSRDMPLCLNYAKESMIPTSAQSIWLKKRRG
jgi:predicted O-methyltransferase YrrM